MKNILTAICLIICVSALAQKPIYLTPNQLFKEIESSKKVTVLQFFNPNCADSIKIMSAYKKFQEKYSDKVDFYFIGITSKEHLIESQAIKTAYTYKIYVADASVEKDIYERRQVFCKKLNVLIKGDNDDFLTLYLDKNDSVIYAGDEVEINDAAIKALYD